MLNVVYQNNVAQLPWCRCFLLVGTVKLVTTESNQYVESTGENFVAIQGS